MNGKRVAWIDTVRAVAMLSVVLGHMHVGKTERIWLYSFHMPIFFMISGVAYFLSSKSREMSISRYIKHRARGLLIPYFGLNFLMLPVWYLSFKILGNSKTPVKNMVLGIFCSNQEIVTGPTNATWFLCTLFLTTVCFFLIERLLKNNFGKVAIWSIIIGACGFIVSFTRFRKINFPWHINVVPVAVFFFFIGAAFMKYHETIMKNFEKHKFFYASIFMLIGSAAGIKNGKITMHGSRYGNGLLFLMSAILISFSLVLYLWNLPECRLISFAGRNTIIITAVHCPMLRFLERFSSTTKDFVESYPNITGIILFGCSMIVAWLIKRYIPFIIGEKRRI